MLGSDVLEVALGLTLFFLLASLMATAVRELIEAVLKTRAMDLERGVRELLDDPRGVSMAQSFFDHAHIFSLFRGAYDAAKLRRSGPLRWLPFRSLFPVSHGQLDDKVGFEAPWTARGSLPTYIPANQFATALIDLVGRGSGSWPYPVSSEPLTLDLLRQRAAALPSPRLQRAVLSAIDHADGEMAKVKTNLETWFNGSMDRVSGAYKRRTQAWLVVIGLAIAVLFNLDAVTVAGRLVDDPALRKAAAAHAEKVVAEKADQEQPETTAASNAASPPDAPPAAKAPAAPVAAAAGPIPKTPPAQADESLSGRIGETSKAVEGLRTDLASIGYPIGWRYVTWERTKAKAPEKDAGPWVLLSPEAAKQARAKGYERRVVAEPAPQACKSLSETGECLKSRTLGTGDWAGILLGWLITAIAISLGAPFWFDMLNKVMVIRSTVKPREKSREEGSEDRKPPPASGAPPPPPPPGPAPGPAPGPGPARSPRAKALVATPESPAPTPLPIAGFEPEEWKPGHTNPGEVL